MRNRLTGYLMAGALALGVLLLAPTSHAEAMLVAPAATAQVPGDLVQTVQYYRYPGYYGRLPN